MYPSVLQRYYQPFLRLVIVFSACLLLATSVFSQVSTFPRNNQLYPRNTKTNKAEITFAGTIEQASGYRWLVLKKYRNGILVASKLIPLVYRNGKAAFKTNDDIKAELSSYRYDLFGSNGMAQTILQSADNIVAGDAYIIQGQSNAVANLRGDMTPDNDANSLANAPGRQFVRVYGSGSASGNYTKAWFMADGNAWFETDGNSGQWGLRLASNLVTEQKIPVAIFNGADPGQAINFFQRDDANPSNPGTNYGRLLNRIKEAGFEKNISAVIWHQGESDVLGVLGQVQLTTRQYKEAFLALNKDWKSDYKNLRKVYLFQMRYGCSMSSVSGALDIQEAQRQLALENKEISVMSTSAANQLLDNNIIGYCHYNFQDGYKLFGDWMTSLLLRDIYGKKLPSSIDAPAPSNALFSGFSAPGIANRVSIALKDKSAAYSLIGDLSSSFRLEGGDFTITGVTLDASNILVDFSRNPGTGNNPTGVSFLGHDATAAPILVNNRGIGLLYFFNLPISLEPCTDKYETRNLNGAKIKFNSSINALISSSTDVDVFNFKTNDKISQVTISLTNLPADFDLFLYDEKWKLIGSSAKTGTSSEQIILNNPGKNDEYLVVVKGKNGAFDADDCYFLNAEIVSTQKDDDDDDDDDDDNEGLAFNAAGRSMETGNLSAETSFLLISPNPVRDHLNISIRSAGNENTELRLVDVNGRQFQVKKQLLQAGINLLRMNVGGVKPGIYILQVIQNNKLTTRKVLITGGLP